MWSHACGDHNPQLFSPSFSVSSKIGSCSVTSASLAEIFEWAVTNICSDEEHKTAIAGRIFTPL
jgi:hypothetical protein